MLRITLTLLCLAAFSLALPTGSVAANLTLDDLYDKNGIVDVAFSPNGKYLATVIRSGNGYRVVVQDPLSGEQTLLARVGVDDAGPNLETRVSAVYWKSDDRVLFRVATLPPDPAAEKRLKLASLRKVGQRVISIRRDGTGLVRLLEDNDDAALYLAFDLGTIRSLLPGDPEHVLLITHGASGRSLYKVNVTTGKGRMIEPANEEVWDWWPDLDGRPIVRVDASFGMMRYFRREDGGKWKKYHSVRLRELKQTDEYEALGPSYRSGEFYVLARPAGAERRGIYLHDLSPNFGPALAEHPRYDIVSADVSRDGKRITRYCYIVHVQVCESVDAGGNEHLAAVRAVIKESANVTVIGDSRDGRTLLLQVEGPSVAPAYYLYRLNSKQLKLIGYARQAVAGKDLPTASAIEYVARDGVKISGYLTRPPGAADASSLPLVVMPHGGPEARDHLTFDVTVEYLASRGYAVFQPNFRGSDGFGRGFAESGHGQWGRKMQDDVTDGVNWLVERKIADPARMCILGASYGGYAALAGATLTPGLYRCVISMAGLANLSDFLKYRRKLHGANSELYTYWKNQIGDPEVDKARIASVSPALLIDRIVAPILLVHSDADDIVPFEQSRDMKKLLDKSGRKTELITLEGEDHSEWSEPSMRRVLTAVDAFLRDKIGPGFEINRGTP